jgi:hypothetical protein
MFEGDKEVRCFSIRNYDKSTLILPKSPCYLALNGV